MQYISYHYDNCLNKDPRSTSMAAGSIHDESALAQAPHTFFAATPAPAVPLAAQPSTQFVAQLTTGAIPKNFPILSRSRDIVHSPGYRSSLSQSRH